MNKRDFIKSGGLVLGGLGFAGSTSQALTPDPQKYGQPAKIVKARRLEKGNKVLLIAPGTNVSDPVLIRKAMKSVERLGLVPIVHDSLTQLSGGYSTKSATARADALMYGFESDEIKALWCIRGGYGSVDILDKLDYSRITENPKVLIGYSDITALHNALFLKSGLICLHGPVALSEMTTFTATALETMLFEANQGTVIQLQSDDCTGIRYSLRTRITKGRILGGNLSLVSSLIGTPYMPDYSAAVVYLEDVGESPYRIHRMLKQLELSGQFIANQALIFGKCDDCGKGSSHVSDYTENEAYLEIASRLKAPVSLNNMIGHTKDQATIPNGAFVEANLENYTIKLLESPYD